METIAFQIPLYFRCMSKSLRHNNRSINNRRPNDALPQNLQVRFSSLTVKTLPRRVVLHFIGFSSILLPVNPVFAAPIPDMKEPKIIRTLKLASGVRIQEIVEGEGQEASEGDLVEVNYVCRRSNGYFVHSTVDQLSGESAPVILPLDENQIIKGLKEVLVGMKVGGKRRALIPPSVGYINENLKPVPEEFGPRRSLLSHTNEPLIFERLPFTLGFIGSMVGTIYVSMVLHHYILSVPFSVIQVLALGCYAISYFPGGSAGMKFLSSVLTSLVMRCFGR